MKNWNESPITKRNKLDIDKSRATKDTFKTAIVPKAKESGRFKIISIYDNFLAKQIRGWVGHKKMCCPDFLCIQIKTERLNNNNF